MLSCTGQTEYTVIQNLRLACIGKIQHKWVTGGSCLKNPESLRFRTGLHCLSGVRNLVGWSPVSSCRHYWRINGRSYHTVWMLEGGIFKSQVSWKTRGGKEEVFVQLLLLMSLSVITHCHLFSYLFISHSHWGCIHHLLSHQMAHQVQNGTVAGFWDPE